MRLQQYTAAFLILSFVWVYGCEESGSSDGAANDVVTKDSTADLQTQEPVIVEEAPYIIGLRPAETQPGIGLHSFAFATHDEKWLIIGGRKDGFHRTSALGGNFTTQFANDHCIVINPATGQSWSQLLPRELRTFLRSSNMQYYQDGDVLYIVGGYGSDCEDNRPDCYGTYPNVTAIKVPEVVHGIINNNQGLAHHMVTIEDPRMQVTGGGLQKIGSDFFLVFGQNYKQEYEAGVTGEYTEQVRSFKLSINFRKEELKISDYHEHTDPTGVKGKTSLYHRRDLNVVEAIDANGTKGITVYGGVFDSTGGGWVNPIYIKGTGQLIKAKVDRDFEQKTNQYECAHILMFDPTTKTMYTTLLGGIGANGYVDSVLTPDPLLPFVNIISTIIRRSDGSTIEAIQPATETMPKLLGANGIFVPAAEIPTYQGTDNIIDYSKLADDDAVMIGYFFGGILAFAPHSDEARPTEANNVIYEVWLNRK